jgi:acyl carrier protein
MDNTSFRADPLRSRLKHFIVDTLNLSDLKADWITDNEPLMGGRIRLDSLDALELFMGLEEEFGIVIVAGAEARDAVSSIATLAEYIRTRVAESKATGAARQRTERSA